ncbi:DUF4260 domain-containing protein [Chitinibacter sp. SCUT-21]|uniref:DUF4260 family protein n=1 Tax=Chitinibacter sp. SCUT-21 TaxID=2970891 RepID=UPI0035A72808
MLPDLALLAYLISRPIGALVYNSTHSYVGALALLGAGFVLKLPLCLGLALIWCAHIGFDRALGYGLKYTAGFHLTHLGAIGRVKTQ